jgi:hypothetical protein
VYLVHVLHKQIDAVGAQVGHQELGGQSKSTLKSKSEVEKLRKASG